MANLPASFRCPISLMPMQDPYIDAEGNSYEWEAIVEWLQRSPTSPVTRNPLSLSQLAPNRGLRQLYTDWVAQNGVPADANPTLAAPTSNGSSHSATSWRITASSLTSSWDESHLPDARSAASTELDDALGVAVSVAPADGVPAVAVRTSHAVVGEGEGFCEVLSCVSVAPPEGAAGRTAVDVCCVVDISGSMCATAKVQSSDGTVESHGLSLLDIVKHGVRTVMHSLGEHDRLSLVVFCSKASVVWDLTPMTPSNRAECHTKLAVLRPIDSTNLWAGLELGIQTLEKAACPTRLSHLMILTDGCPTVEPPRGTLAMLERLRAKSGGALPCSVNAFGFGYELDSQLLHGIAEEGCGSYAFIPDAGFVGTIFVNATSNILTGMSRAAAKIDFQVPEGAEVTAVLGGSLQSGHILLPPLNYGQPKDVLIRLRLPTPTPPPTLLTGTLTYTTSGVEGERSLPFVVERGEGLSGASVARWRAVESIKQAMQQMRSEHENDAARAIQAAVADLGGVEGGEGILADLSGQVAEAFSRGDWYKKWGRHYLPSLARAHEIQQCLNFKDPGVQAYGGHLFNTIRDAADDIFCRLPPPTPSNNPPHRRGLAGSASPPRNVSMSTYHDSRNGCFAPRALVRMACGGVKSACDVVKGDAVRSGDGRVSHVVCVVRVQCEGGGCDIVNLGNGCVLTAWHPVRGGGGAWEFPCESVEPRWDSACDEVYNFVLEDPKHTLIVGGVECVALGHTLKAGARRVVRAGGWVGESDVVSHPYFGTLRVRADLAALDPEGWAAGCVRFEAGCLGRDSETSLLYRYLPEKLIAFAGPRAGEAVRVAGRGAAVRAF